MRKKAMAKSDVRCILFSESRIPPDVGKMMNKMAKCSEMHGAHRLSGVGVCTSDDWRVIRASRSDVCASS